MDNHLPHLWDSQTSQSHIGDQGHDQKKNTNPNTGNLHRRLNNDHMIFPASTSSLQLFKLTKMEETIPIITTKVRQDLNEFRGGNYQSHQGTLGVPGLISTMA